MGMCVMCHSWYNAKECDGCGECDHRFDDKYDEEYDRYRDAEREKEYERDDY